MTARTGRPFVHNEKHIWLFDICCWCVVVLHSHFCVDFHSADGFVGERRPSERQSEKNENDMGIVPSLL